MHDNTVDRVLKGKGHVKDLNLVEIQSMPYLQCSTVSAVHTKNDSSNEVAPEVNDVYKLCKDKNVRLFIEAKDLFDCPRTLALELARFFRENEHREDDDAEDEATDNDKVQNINGSSKAKDNKGDNIYDIACVICFN